MRVMVLVKATNDSEKGLENMDASQNANVAKMFEAMTAFNEQLVKAGILVVADGLQPSRKAKRIQFSDGKKTVVDGPFPHAQELVAGFWIWDVKSMDEAMEWAQRCPNPSPSGEGQIEIRAFASDDDMGDAYTPELRAREDRLKRELEKRS